MNINKHPILKQAVCVCMAIEECGASEKLTHAVVLASELMESIDKLVDKLPENCWRKCSEEMPTEEVLLLTTSKVIEIGAWYNNSWRTEGSHWEGATLVSTFRKDDITHWMPLPILPLT